MPARELLADHARGVEALGLVVRRHPDVDDHQVGRALAHELEELGRVARLADDREPGPLEQAREPLAEQDVVVRKRYADRVDSIESRRLSATRTRRSDVSGGLTRRVVVACGLLLVIVAAAFAVLIVAIDGMRDSATAGRPLPGRAHGRERPGAARRGPRDGPARLRDHPQGALSRPVGRRAEGDTADSRRLVRLTDDPRQRRRAVGIAAPWRHTSATTRSRS